MKRLVLVSIPLFVLPLAVGCGGKRSKTSGVAATTSGTAGTNSGTAPTSSGTAPTGSGTAPGVTPSPSPSPSPSPIGGTGVFRDGSAALPANSGDDWTVAAGDVDGDTDIDMVIGTNAGALRLLRNDGASFTEAANAFPNLTFNCTDVHLVDMDKDGDLDVVLAANYEPVRMFRNNGAGVFALASAAPTTNPCLTYKIGVGDLNGDTYPDVYMANAGQSTSTQGADVVLLNTQTGSLAVSPNALPGLLDDTLGVALGDVDGDGDLDVLGANFGTAHALLINDGAGVFSDASANLPAGLLGKGSTAVAAGDVNQDGFVDFYIANEGFAPASGGLPAGDSDTLLLGNGTGTFQDASILVPTNADVGFNVRLVDVNADSYPDVILANLRGVQRLYLNNQGVLTDSTANYPALNQTASSSMGVAVADFNGDRALDVAYAQRGANPWLLTGIPR